MPPARFRARAYAKINLGLKIVARRPDGFHELRTVFQTIALADTLVLERHRGRGVSLALSGLPAPTGDANLAYRAARLAADRWHLPGAIALALDKQIPLGAGLGGGSADAAAVLRMLARACPKPASLAAQMALARELGSDVPNFLLGGTVLGLGRGDEVYALADLAPWSLVLAMPQASLLQGVLTADAFALWDRQHPQALQPAPHSATLVEFCSLVDQVLPAFRTLRNRGRVNPQGRARPKVHAGIENDFLAGVFSHSPDFSRIHLQLRRTSAAWVGLTGSGAAQFGLFSALGPAASAARRLALSHRSWLTRFVARAEYHRGLQIG